MVLRGISLFISILIISAGLSSRADFQVPSLSGPVMDQVGYLTRSDRQELTQLLAEFNERGVAQVQVLVLPDLQGLPIEQASLKIAEQWKLGNAKKDNGVLLLIAAQERAMRIEVGQGLEGAIPDIIAKRIISDQVIPLFRAKRFSAGIVVGVHEIVRLADKEFADQHGVEEQEDSLDPTLFVIFILFLIVYILGRFGGGRGRFYGGGGGFGDGFGSGNWSGGGDSWSGGGGGFSGGGASGDW